MKVIGGFFELELRKGKEYHNNAIKLNTGRNAFEYILKVNNYKKVYLPYYTCSVMLEPIKKLFLEYSYYHIDQNFLPLFNWSDIKEDEVFVYTNYFGICDNIVFKVSKNCKNLIIDNAQAFYSKPINGIDTFYSPRKFFGVPDGAYLYCNKLLNEYLEQDESLNRMGHLIGRIDKSAEEYYEEFLNNENLLSHQPIKRMSKLTISLMRNIDYNKVKNKRKENFEFIHKRIGKLNELKIELEEDSVPMVYPFLISNGKQIREKLIKNKIYIATYWPNLISELKNDTLEFYLASNLLPLPIDQRYDIRQLNKLINFIL